MTRFHRMRLPLGAVAFLLAMSINIPGAAAADAVAGEVYVPDGHMLKLNFFNIENADARVTFRFVAASGSTRVVCEVPIKGAIRQGHGVSASTSECPDAGAFQETRVTGVVSVALEIPLFIEVPLFFDDPLKIEVPLFLKSMELFGPPDASGERDRIWGTNGTSIVNFVMSRRDPSVRMRVTGAQGASAGQMIFLAPVTSEKAGEMTVTVSNMVNPDTVMAISSIYNGATGRLEQTTWTSPLCPKLEECQDSKAGYALRAGRDATASLLVSKWTGVVAGVATVLFDDPIVGFDDPIVGFDDPIVGFDDPIVGISRKMVSGSLCVAGGDDLFTTTVAVNGANAPARSTTLRLLRDN